LGYKGYEKFRIISLFKTSAVLSLLSQFKPQKLISQGSKFMRSPTNILAPTIQPVGLNMAVSAGQVYVNNTLGSVPPTIVVLTANATNFIFLNTTSGAIQVSTSAFPAPSYPIATVFTTDRRVGSYSDSRPDVFLATGSGGGSPNFSDAEIPAGAINGSNRTFTLANTPNPAASVQLYLNGVFQQQNFDYTITGVTITFAGAPLTGDSLETFYRFAGSGGAVPNFSDGELATGSINGINRTFILANIPSPALSLVLYLNGVFQQQTTDYALSSNTITTAVAPMNGDILEAFYRF
jgi:hypothetical protein